MTEKQVLEAIEKAVNSLAPSFVFAHYTLEDIKQHGYLCAIKLLNKGTYDPKRPLENYIYIDLKCKFINLRRDHQRRNDPPCKPCHKGTPCDKANGAYCKKYNSWLKLNNTKANLASPVSIDHVSEERESRVATTSSVYESVEIDDILARIDAELPVEHRATYLQMRAGVSVPKAKRLQIEGLIKDILKGDIEVCPSVDD